jgi:shikimate kinase
MSFANAVAESHSAITVVSAFASGKGVAIGIDIPCRVKAELRNVENSTSRVIVTGGMKDPHGLVEKAVEKSLRSLRVALPDDKSLFLTINSKIPTAVGLKSSSAVSVAVVRAIFELFSPEGLKTEEMQRVLRISCQASIESGASLTGAYDDAAAGLLGGLVFSDNLRFKLLGHTPIKPSIGSIVKILVPLNKEKLTSSLNMNSYRAFRQRAEEAIDFARRGIVVQAMLLNSIIHASIHHYSMRPIVSAISEGACASGISGKGPAVTAICSSNKAANKVERLWIAENPGCKVITAHITAPVRI